MKKETTEKLELPAGTSFAVEGNTISAKGKYGEISRKIDDPSIEVKLEGNTITLRTPGTSKRESMRLGTWKSHIKNMFAGAQNGHSYKLKICSGHFPMNVSVTDKEFIVKNFLGEKVPRKVQLRRDVKVKIEGDIVNIESASKEMAGQQAADIEQLCRIRGRDSRIFQDGIWIIEKDGKQIK